MILLSHLQQPGQVMLGPMGTHKVPQKKTKANQRETTITQAQKKKLSKDVNATESAQSELIETCHILWDYLKQTEVCSWVAAVNKKGT